MKKQRKRYNKGTRQDYTAGGRVGYAVGDIVNYGNEDERKTGAENEDNAQAPVDETNEDTNSTDNTNTNTDTPTPEDTPTPDDTLTPPPLVDPEERRKRIEAAGKTVTDAATGIVPTPAVIPDVTKVDETIEADVKQMTDEDLSVAVAGKASAGVAPTAATGTASTTDAPASVTAQGYTADTTGSATATGETGTLSEGADMTEDEIAAAANVADVAPIVGVDVDIPAGALAARVIGKISPEAISVAAQNTGSSLRKLSRAKKQLRKAGLTEDQISTIGDDIEDLEDRLDDFTEEERGLIAGLDKDTLVDAQMSRLLDGMQNGEMPMWASPAVSKVEQMLASRGLSASSVGQAALTNAIIQAALPMAQSNATALQGAATQQRDIEARESEANAQRSQQTALSNASTVFQMDMAQFTADQQRTLSNSKFMQTVSLTNASNDQQAAIQNAVIQSQINLAEANSITRLTSQNASAFLQMDMSNLSNDQQATMFTAQAKQQAMLSNQAASNASKQFNAASENQTNQFMANLATNVALDNTRQKNAMETFNAQQKNVNAAQNANRAADVSKLNAQLETQIDQYNSQQEFSKNQWNVQNSQAIEQANTQWRRQSNTINSAAQNAVNQQNAQNAFGLSSQATSFLWQELRDQADFDFKASENELQRKASLTIAALGNDGLIYKGRNVESSLKAAMGILNGYSTTPTGNPAGPDGR